MKIYMEIKVRIAIVLICIAEISAANRSLEIRLQSAEDHIDKLFSQILNLKDYDEEIATKQEMNTNIIHVISNTLRHYQETWNRSIKQMDSLSKQIEILSKKYEILLEKYEDVENKISNLEQCPHGWIPYMNSCYILKKQAVSWFQARDWCRNNKAKLVEYEDMDEVTFVLSTAKAHHFWDNGGWAGFWVGGNDIYHEGVFKWSRSHIYFQYWLPGQPDRISIDEDCMMTLVNKQGRWNDAPCTLKFVFVCEK